VSEHNGKPFSLNQLLERFRDDVIIPSDTAEALRVQAMMVDQLKAHDFSERDIFAIRLAVEEVLVNAIKHGNGLDRSKSVRISYHVHDETFFVRIADEGRGFDPNEIPDPRCVENLERPCGRGLLLVRHYMTDVHYLERGTVCVMWKRRNGQPIT
jgi:serine/threonine-protein kinase RsbW